MISGIKSSPKELPDHVYSYTSWMKKRLHGRGVELLGYVRSKCGQSNFRCDNGHNWRTRPMYVAEGAGCEVCGLGERTLEEMSCIINPAYLFLSKHPNKPGFIKITLEYGTIDECFKDHNEGWLKYRYRDVEEGPDLAESLIWKILGFAKPNINKQIEIDDHVVEKAFRELIYHLRHEIASVEKMTT